MSEAEAPGGDTGQSIEERMAAALEPEPGPSGDVEPEPAEEPGSDVDQKSKPAEKPDGTDPEDDDAKESDGDDDEAEADEAEDASEPKTESKSQKKRRERKERLVRKLQETEKERDDLGGRLSQFEEAVPKLVGHMKAQEGEIAHLKAEIERLARAAEEGTPPDPRDAEIARLRHEQAQIEAQQKLRVQQYAQQRKAAYEAQKGQMVREIIRESEDIAQREGVDGMRLRKALAFMREDDPDATLNDALAFIRPPLPTRPAETRATKDAPAPVKGGASAVPPRRGSIEDRMLADLAARGVGDSGT